MDLVDSPGMAEWYVVNTNPRSEDLVAKILGIEYEVFAPKLPVHRVRKDRPATQQLFPGYLFVRLSLDKSKWAKINFTQGVRKLLTFDGRPTPMPSEVLSRIKANVQSPHRVRSSCPYTRGDILRFIEGPFKGCEGIFTGELGRGDRVKVLLSAVRWYSFVEADIQSLKKVGWTDGTGC